MSPENMVWGIVFAWFLSVINEDNTVSISALEIDRATSSGTSYSAVADVKIGKMTSLTTSGVARGSDIRPAYA